MKFFRLLLPPLQFAVLAAYILLILSSPLAPHLAGWGGVALFLPLLLLELWLSRLEKRMRNHFDWLFAAGRAAVWFLLFMALRDGAALDLIAAVHLYWNFLRTNEIWLGSSFPLTCVFSAISLAIVFFYYLLCMKWKRRMSPLLLLLAASLFWGAVFVQHYLGTGLTSQSARRIASQPGVSIIHPLASIRQSLPAPAKWVFRPRQLYVDPEGTVIAAYGPSENTRENGPSIVRFAKDGTVKAYSSPTVRCFIVDEKEGIIIAGVTAPPRLVVLDKETLSERQAIDSPVFGELSCMTLDPEGGIVCFAVLNGGASSLIKYDLNRKTVTRTAVVPLNRFEEITRIIKIPGQSSLLVCLLRFAGREGDNVFLFDWETLTEKKRIKVPGRGVFAAAYCPRRSSFFLTSLNLDRMWEFDSGLEAGKTYGVPFGVRDTFVSSGEVFLLGYSTGELCRFDPSEGKITRRWFVGDRCIGICAGGEDLYVSSLAGILKIKSPAGGNPLKP